MTDHSKLRNHSRCRIAYKYHASGRESHGTWQPLSMEESLLAQVARDATENCHLITSWVEYE